MYDGQPVAYNGVTGPLRPGDEGQVLTVESTYATVMWRTGSLAGRTTTHLLEDEDLVNLTPLRERGYIEASLDDSLEVGLPVVTSAREAYDESGPAGVVERLAYTGQLGLMRSVAEEAFALVAHHVRSSPSLHAVVAQLDEGEIESIVQVASLTLLREYLDSGD